MTWIEINGEPVPVRQGPAWLAELLYDPSPELQLAAYALAAVVVLGAVIGWYRNGGMDEEIAYELLRNVSIFISAAALTQMLVMHGPFGYVPDVLIGGIGGFAIGIVVARGFVEMMEEADLSAGIS